jgi:protein-tyrosine-phosphatase
MGPHRDVVVSVVALSAILAAACSTTPHVMTTMQPHATVLFMCPYGGAKSVIAASYFRRLTEAKGLRYVAAAVAAETPYEQVPPKVAALLEEEGFAVGSFRPRQVTRADLDGATRVVSIDCDLSQLDTSGARIERWDDVPKVSDDLTASAAAIRRHVLELVEQLERSSPGVRQR